MGSPRQQQQQARGNEVDNAYRSNGDRGGYGGGGGKIREYPKHRSQHMASAGPYHSSPQRGSSYGGGGGGGWPQPHEERGRYQSNASAPDVGSSAGHAARDSGRRVYVGNLSWDVKWMNLKDHMRRAGEVDHCDVLVEATGRSKGCGLVTYRTVEMAREAIRTLTDTELMGRKIFVREDREDGAMGPPPPASSSLPFAGNGGGYPSQSGGRPSPYSSGGGPPQAGGPIKTSRVYVSNLSWSVKWQELKDFMKQAGNVIQADVLEEPSGRSKGCGLVEFDCPEAAERSIRMFNDTQFGDRKVFIREDREATRRPGSSLRPPPSGFPRGGGGPPPSRGADRGPPPRFESGPSSGRGFDVAPQRGYDVPPSRGYTSSAPPSRGYESSAPSRGFDAAPPSRGYDAAVPPSRGYDSTAPSRGFDAGHSSRGYDGGSRGYDPYNAPAASTSQRFDNNPPPRSYDVYDPPSVAPLSRPRYDSAPLSRENPGGFEAYEPAFVPPTRGPSAYSSPPRDGRPSAYDQPSRGYEPRSSYPPSSSSPPLATSKLFVGNVPFDVSWQDMKDLFRSVANIDHVEIPSAADGRAKGYALVQCSSISDAQAAIARLHNSEFKGRYLEVRMDRPRFG